MHVRIPDNATVTCISQRIVSPAPLSDDEIHAALSFPSLTTGLDHWSLWTLICLYRHLQRQRWVGYIVETRLRTDLRQLGCAGSLGHPEEFSQSGMVPGEPDWKYEFHGRGCCLTNKKSGETIDVDFTDEGSSDRIDCYFYSQYLAALRDLIFPETLLKRSSPFEHSWQIEISRLAASGCSDSEHAFQLTEIGIQLAESLNPIVDSLEKLMADSEVHSLRKVVFTALSLGDPVLAQQFSAQAQLSPELASLIRSKCLAEKENRSKKLLPLLGEDPNRSGAL